MMKFGITGEAGFAGSHLKRSLLENGDVVIPFERAFFDDPARLKIWVSKCERVIHFAGLSRDEDGERLYRTNLALARALDEALQEVPRPLYFASTTHFAKDLPYHRSKRDSRAVFEASGRYPVVTFRIANLFGPGSRPFYNSVVSTFCALASAGKTPETICNAELRLLHIGELVKELQKILHSPAPETGVVTIDHKHTVMLPELWEKLVLWHRTPPVDPTGFEKLLWETFSSYAPIQERSRSR